MPARFATLLRQIIPFSQRESSDATLVARIFPTDLFSLPALLAFLR
jgi:hypothetical protein